MNFQQELINRKQEVINFKLMGINPSNVLFWKGIYEGLGYGSINWYCGGCVNKMMNDLYDKLVELKEV